MIGHWNHFSDRVPPVGGVDRVEVVSDDSQKPTGPIALPADRYSDPLIRRLGVHKGRRPLKLKYHPTCASEADPRSACESAR
jgi:hypothetical protein